MRRRFYSISLLILAGAAGADEPALRPSARLLFAQPDLLRPGACAMYREGGAGWIATDPVFWLRGKVVAAEIRPRRLDRCPEVPGKTLDHYTRDEFVRLANARPCVSRDDQVREEPAGVVRLQVSDWETPWAKRAANAYRLFQGHFLDKPLRKGGELEIEADLLSACDAS